MTDHVPNKQQENQPAPTCKLESTLIKLINIGVVFVLTYVDITKSFDVGLTRKAVLPI